LLPRPRVNDNIFPGLSSGSDGEYCTWLSKNKLAPLLGASSYTIFDAGSFQGTFINPSLYSALGARWGPNAPTSNQFVHAGLSAAIFCKLSISRRRNRPISISLFCLCHHVLSVLASCTRPCRLTHVKRHLAALYTAMEMLNGELPRRLDQSIAQHSNWLSSFQSLPMVHLLACLVCALRAATKK